MILLTYMYTKADLPPLHFFWKNFSFGRSRGDREIMHKAVADPGEPPYLIFGPNWGPKGRSNFFFKTVPGLSQGLDDHPPPPPSPLI